MCICVWFKQSNLTKLLAWGSRLIPPFLLRNCDWSNCGGLMVCCNLRAFFSGSREWSGWGSCRHNCCANLELISEPKVNTYQISEYPSAERKKKNLNCMFSCPLERINKKKGKKKLQQNEEKKKTWSMFDFFPAFFVCQEKRKKIETERLNHKRYREESILGDRSKQETKRRKQFTLNTYLSSGYCFLIIKFSYYYSLLLFLNHLVSSRQKNNNNS